jgi:hypothetical protein
VGAPALRLPSPFGCSLPASSDSANHTNPKHYKRKANTNQIGVWKQKGEQGDESGTDEGGWFGPRGKVQQLLARFPHGLRADAGGAVSSETRRREGRGQQGPERGGCV